MVSIALSLRAFGIACRLSVSPEVSAEGPLDADAEQFRHEEEKQSASLEGRARSSDPWSGIIGKWKSGRSVLFITDALNELVSLKYFKSSRCSGTQDGAVNREFDVGEGASPAVEVSNSSDARSSLAQVNLNVLCLVCMLK